MFSMCRHLYNWNLEERITAYEKEKRTVTYLEQQNALPKLKQEKPWFKGVYSLSLQDVLRRLDKAYQKFFDKSGGFPKYKKRGQWTSITYSDHRKRPKEGMLTVSKLGQLKIVYHREIPEDASIKTLTLVKEGSKWFACFSLELPDQVEPKPMQSAAVGVDLGLESFFYTSDGEQESAPRYLRSKLQDLSRLQRKLSRTEKRTLAYQKVLRALQKAYYKIRCLRQSFFYEKAYRLFSKYDIVFVEDLNISKMGRVSAKNSRGLRRSIYDAAWGSFIGILRHVAEKLGRVVKAVNPAYTSAACSSCGMMVPKGLSTRTHSCPECGFVVNRDHNAAINILRLGLESLG